MQSENLSYWYWPCRLPVPASERGYPWQAGDRPSLRGDPIRRLIRPCDVVFRVAIQQGRDEFVGLVGNPSHPRDHVEIYDVRVLCEIVFQRETSIVAFRCDDAWSFGCGVESGFETGNMSVPFLDDLPETIHAFAALVAGLYFPCPSLYRRHRILACAVLTGPSP